MNDLLYNCSYSKTMHPLIHLLVCLMHSIRCASSLAVARVRSTAQTDNSTHIMLPGHESDEVSAFATNTTQQYMNPDNRFLLTCNAGDYGTHLPVANVKNAWQKIPRSPAPLIFSYGADGDVRLGKIIYDGMSPTVTDIYLTSAANADFLLRASDDRKVCFGISGFDSYRPDITSWLELSNSAALIVRTCVRSNDRHLGGSATGLGK